MINIATNFSFDGVMKDYIRILEIKRPYWYSIERNLSSVPNRVGEWLRGKEVKAMVIPVKIRVEADSKDNLMDISEEMADWLVTDKEKELIFNDRPNRRYYAVVEGDFIPDLELGMFSTIEINFLCPEPHKFGEAKKEYAERKFTWETIALKRWEDLEDGYIN